MGRRRVGEYGDTSGGTGQLDGPHGVDGVVVNGVVEHGRGVGDDGGRQGVGDVQAPTMAPGSLWSRTCDQVMMSGRRPNQSRQGTPSRRGPNCGYAGRCTQAPG